LPVGKVRRGFYWNNIEPANDAWNFAGYDVMVPLIKNAGLEPVAMLTHGVGWAMPNGSPSDIDPADFTDFTGTTAARYADEVDYYEIWNEPNTSRFWIRSRTRTNTAHCSRPPTSPSTRTIPRPRMFAA
jgi:beta-glucosidase/6-phospho-beta-glucosidase/beta-galactosidase